MTEQNLKNKKHKHNWVLKSDMIGCASCTLPLESFDGNNIRVLSMGGGVQTCYILFKFYQNYDIVAHADIANGDREHGEHDITYWILDNMIKPFCEEKDIPLWIISHPKGGVFQRSMDEKKLPVISRRWCTQDHKVDLMTKSIRKGLQADFPKNVVISDLGFSYDEYWRADNAGSKVKYNLLDYPLVNMRITRKECIEWLNENHPIIINGNKIDWKDAKSGCWFCPYWKVSKLKELPLKKKEELIKMEENSAHNLTFKKKPMKIILGIDSHTLMEYPLEKDNGESWTEEDENNDNTACESGYCHT